LGGGGRAARGAPPTALAAADLPALLSSEAAIEDAFAAVQHDSGDPADREALVAELDRLQSALVRCRRLGAGLKTFARLSSEAQGRFDGYGPSGSYAGPGVIARG
jgi:hypothetical protein